MEREPLECALMAEWREAMRLGNAAEHRAEAIERYAYAVPSPAVVQLVADLCPTGIVELGAGTGYWARLLWEAGVDVVAYDIQPVDSGTNEFFPGGRAWFPVGEGDEAVLPPHADRTLLLVWPTRNEEWPWRAVTAFHQAGGARLVYVGEPPGGRTGDDRFHASLGEILGCGHCGYGLHDTMCVCGVEQLWRRCGHQVLPHWPGFDDDLYVYDRA